VLQCDDNLFRLDILICVLVSYVLSFLYAPIGTKILLNPTYYFAFDGGEQKTGPEEKNKLRVRLSRIPSKYLGIVRAPPEQTYLSVQLQGGKEEKLMPVQL
jgi:hypothetical protein